MGNCKFVFLSLSIMSVLFSSAVFAVETTSANMKVKLVIERSCEVSVNDLDFGKHKSTENGDVLVQTDADITCTNGTSYTLTADPADDFQMTGPDGTTKISYTVTGDSDGTGDLSKDGIPGTGSGVQQIIPIYGLVTAEALNTAPAGDYSDTLKMTVTY